MNRTLDRDRRHWAKKKEEKMKKKMKPLVAKSRRDGYSDLDSGQARAADRRRPPGLVALASWEPLSLRRGAYAAERDQRSRAAAPRPRSGPRSTSR